MVKGERLKIESMACWKACNSQEEFLQQEEGFLTAKRGVSCSKIKMSFSRYEAKRTCWRRFDLWIWYFCTT